MKPNPKGGPRGDRALTAETTEKALEMHGNGKSFRDIGHALGISQSSAYDLIMKVKKVRIATKADEVVNGQVAILESLIQKTYDEFVEFGDKKSGLLLVKLQDRMAKFLGLDSAQKLEVTGALSEGDVTPAKALELLKAKFGAAAAPEDAKEKDDAANRGTKK